MTVKRLGRIAPICGALLLASAMPLFAAPPKPAEQPARLIPVATNSQESPERAEARRLAAEVNRVSGNLAASLRRINTSYQIPSATNAAGTSTTGAGPTEAIAAPLTAAEFRWFKARGGATWMRDTIRREMQGRGHRSYRIAPSDPDVPDGMYVVYVAPGFTP